MSCSKYPCRFSIQVLAWLAGYGLLVGCTEPQDGDREPTIIRELEFQRLRSLVDADMDLAERLHAADFQLITPDGSVYTKEAYLGAIGSGELDYLVWEVGEITVRMYGDAAAIRYDDSQFEIVVNGKLARTGALRHTNVYERRNGQWQVVWSQASGGQVP